MEPEAPKPVSGRVLSEPDMHSDGPVTVDEVVMTPQPPKPEPYRPNRAERRQKYRKMTGADVRQAHANGLFHKLFKPPTP